MNALTAQRADTGGGSPLDRAFASVLAVSRPTPRAEIDRARRHAASERLPLAWAAVALGIVSEFDATMILARASELPFVDLSEVSPSALALKLVPEKIVRRYSVLPLAVDDRTITMATADPSDLAAEQDVSFAAGRRPRMVVASPPQLQAAIDRAYPPTGGVERIVGRLRTGTAPGAPDAKAATGKPSTAVADLCEHILAGALESRASEVWLDTVRGQLAVQYRVDGGVTPVINLPADAAAAVTARFRSLAQLAPTGPPRPQQGTFSTSVRRAPTDVRVATSPTADGERLVLRVSRADDAPPPLDALGYDRASLDDIRAALRHDRGLIVFCGPPASGKTTSLYAALGDLRNRHASLVTVENPIERFLQGIAQFPAGGPANVEVAALIRSALLQDPAVLMVGDTRDAETAREVGRAAGDRLVLTSVHAPDVTSALAELMRLGVDPGTLAGTLQLAAAQRLMRRLCPDCLVLMNRDELRLVAPRFAEAASVARPGPGCDRCGHTGYLGRLVAAEVVLPDGRMRDALREGARQATLRESVERGRYRSIRESADQAVIDGISSPDEVSRVFHDVVRVPGRPRQQPLVLVVDDDRMVRLLVRHLLEKSGYSVIEGENGRQGVERCLRERPDLLVLDLMMPEVDGYQALGLIRRELALAEMPVLVLTADDAPEAERRVIELGADDYLIKPFERTVLVQRARAALSRAARINA